MRCRPAARRRRSTGPSCAYLAGDGLTPDDVARLTFERITSGAKWIHPHPEQSRPLLEAMTADFESGRG